MTEQHCFVVPIFMQIWCRTNEALSHVSRPATGYLFRNVLRKDALFQVPKIRRDKPAILTKLSSFVRRLFGEVLQVVE
jgi:hypothetical protein